MTKQEIRERVDLARIRMLIERGYLSTESPNSQELQKALQQFHQDIIDTYEVK